jgi:hypothetical protein
LAATASVGLLLAIAIEPFPLIYAWPLVFLNQLQHHTKCTYRLSQRLANFPQDKSYVLSFNSIATWRKQPEERRKHLRKFDAHLGEFFDDFEREYLSKSD